MGLYNAAGPGQSIDPALAEAIAAIDRPLDLQIVVALSCTMCPELVIAAQKIAASNPLVTAKVYDVNHFPELRERYKIMSVPCLIINKAKWRSARRRSASCWNCWQNRRPGRLVDFMDGP